MARPKGSKNLTGRDIFHAELLYSAKNLSYSTTDSYGDDEENCFLTSGQPDFIDNLIKKEALHLLSDEAKEVLDILFNQPEEVKKIANAVQSYSLYDMLAWYLRKRWKKRKLVNTVMHELTLFTKFITA